MGRFNMAAKNHVTIAELYENECPDMELCIQHYQKAADYYKGEEAKSSATKCLIKVAQYAAQLEQYQKAISVFEEIAMWEADHPTLKYAAKNHFFQSLLCYLCIDIVGSCSSFVWIFGFSLLCIFTELQQLDCPMLIFKDWLELKICISRYSQYHFGTKLSKFNLDAQHALKRYEEASPSFADTREAKFIKVDVLKSL
ncbi:unnamed protein product, partial [Strongylus vulgaris]